MRLGRMFAVWWNICLGNIVAVGKNFCCWMDRWVEKYRSLAEGSCRWKDLSTGGIIWWKDKILWYVTFWFTMLNTLALYSTSWIYTGIIVSRVKNIQSYSSVVDILVVVWCEPIQYATTLPPLPLSAGLLGCRSAVVVIYVAARDEWYNSCSESTCRAHTLFYVSFYLFFSPFFRWLWSFFVFSCFLIFHALFFFVRVFGYFTQDVVKGGVLTRKRYVLRRLPRWARGPFFDRELCYSVCVSYQ